mgnify:CR=1 FL=1
MHTIKNNQLEVTINTKGAELASLKTSAMEFMWQADPAVWSRHAPILFPIVGRLKDHEYNYKGELYKMNQHGFVRDTHFKVIKKSENNILFEQVATSKSKVKVMELAAQFLVMEVGQLCEKRLIERKRN